ncbi:LacI family DNA-binding transcriptional regulator [Brevundimonas sp. SORGH_AS_0993]|uniref:LacI family DNA-binding transcriptional regulator n=1 Tax=Brevundimonas sp. SORGH_AS_0993 TaxID=3041794 RepID=UPI0027825345|nr:LacI family DNA-binding transcriptional regulator [Brevundimonas sp. SORGH_AS_0993]MDQ1153701.1 LacI family transcriptional regulator [Brevundimonas sp. SORGH_AS_0993]
MDIASPSAAHDRSRAAKAATIRDVAEHAQVSVASVSRVLNGSGAITESTRQRVLDAVAQLRYVPHVGARSLSTSRTDTIGVILPDLFGEFFSELIRGMDLAARAHGKHLIVSSSHDDAEDTLTAVRSMRGRVDGMIVLSPHVRAASLAADVAGRMPVLLMNGVAEEAGRASIVIDNHGGAVAAIRHVIASGRQRIAHIRGPQGNVEADQRAAGYASALEGQTPIVVEGDFSQVSGHRAATALLTLQQRPDAVFAANDMMAVGALLAFQEAGVRCPEDIAVVGFDDVPIASLMRPALTTMRVNIAEIGRRGVERLIGLVRADAAGAPSDVACEIVRPILVERQSTAASTAARFNNG